VSSEGRDSSWGSQQSDLPAPDESRTYYIGMFPGVKVTIVGVPPCLWCAAPVLRPSMDGPLVCATCDCGINPDGSQWTAQEYAMRRRHFEDTVEQYALAAQEAK
jgi:hypothetical protein